MRQCSTSPGAARRLVSFFCSAKRKSPKKRPPRQTAAGAVPLRCSAWTAAAELAPVIHGWRALRQSSPKAPSTPVLLGGLQGRSKTKASAALGLKRSPPGRSGVFPLTNRRAVAGRRGGVGEDCLSLRHACMAQASSAAAAPDEQRRDTTTVAVRWGGFSLVTFSCPHKRK